VSSRPNYNGEASLNEDRVKSIHVIRSPPFRAHLICPQNRAVERASGDNPRLCFAKMPAPIGRRNGGLDRPTSFASPLPVFDELLANDASKRIRKTILARTHVLPQRAIDQGLVVTPTGRVNLLAKPPQNVIVYSDGDARLTWWCLENSTPFPSTEIVLVLHITQPS
jgi:hypothetical protein